MGKFLKSIVPLSVLFFTVMKITSWLISSPRQGQQKISSSQKIKTLQLPTYKKAQQDKRKSTSPVDEDTHYDKVLTNHQKLFKGKVYPFSFKSLNKVKEGHDIKIPGVPFSLSIDRLKVMKKQKRYYGKVNGQGNFALSYTKKGRLYGRITAPLGHQSYVITQKDDNHIEVAPIARHNLDCTKKSTMARAAGTNYVDLNPIAGSIVPNNPNFIVPSLQSNPHSPNVIYLDFNGEAVEDNYWISRSTASNLDSITLAPFGLDNNFLETTEKERDMIAQIHRVVSQAFSAFDVNVTTDKSVFDTYNPYQRVRIHHLITMSNEDHNDLYPPASGELCYPCSGISQGNATLMLASDTDINSISYFDQYLTVVDTNDHDIEVRHIANTIVHELGHDFGLIHDGYLDPNHPYYQVGQALPPGTTLADLEPFQVFDKPSPGSYGWAPFMGNTDNYIMQWSDAHYPSAPGNLFSGGHNGLQIVQVDNVDVLGLASEHQDDIQVLQDALGQAMWANDSYYTFYDGLHIEGVITDKWTPAMFRFNLPEDKYFTIAAYPLPRFGSFLNLRLVVQHENHLENNVHVDINLRDYTHADHTRWWPAGNYTVMVYGAPLFLSSGQQVHTEYGSIGPFELQVGAYDQQFSYRPSFRVPQYHSFAPGRQNQVINTKLVWDIPEGENPTLPPLTYDWSANPSVHSDYFPLPTITKDLEGTHEVTVSYKDQTMTHWSISTSYMINVLDQPIFTMGYPQSGSYFIHQIDRPDSTVDIMMDVVSETNFRYQWMYKASSNLPWVNLGQEQLSTDPTATISSPLNTNGSPLGYYKLRVILEETYNGRPHFDPNYYYDSQVVKVIGLFITPSLPSVTPTVAIKDNPVTLAIPMITDAMGQVSYQWRKYENGIPVNIPGATGYSYTIPSAQMEHAGYYDIVVSNEFGATTSDMVMLEVHYPPRFILPTVDQVITGKVNDNRMLMTDVVGYPQPTLTWYRKASPTASPVLIAGTSEELALFLQSAGDGAQYFARAQNTMDPTGRNITTIVDSPLFTIDVQHIPVISTPLSGPIHLIEGMDLTLEIAASADPPITSYRWITPSEEITTLSNRLVLSNVTVGHSGTYTVHANNSAGHAESSVVVTVHPVPSFITPEETLTHDHGDTPSLQGVLNAHTIPPAYITYSWSFTALDNQTIGLANNNNPANVYNINAIDWPDEGKYTLTARFFDHTSITKDITLVINAIDYPVLNVPTETETTTLHILIPLEEVTAP